MPKVTGLKTSAAIVGGVPGAQVDQHNGGDGIKGRMGNISQQKTAPAAVGSVPLGTAAQSRVSAEPPAFGFRQSRKESSSESAKGGDRDGDEY